MQNIKIEYYPNLIRNYSIYVNVRTCGTPKSSPNPAARLSQRQDLRNNLVNAGPTAHLSQHQDRRHNLEQDLRHT